jgi:glycine dehydrogenase
MSSDNLEVSGGEEAMPSPQVRMAPDLLAFEDELAPCDTFARRHLGAAEDEVRAMAETMECGCLDDLLDGVVPRDIRLPRHLALPSPLTESEALAALRTMARRNKVFRSFIGLGYHATLLPAVIRRNILENPGWYTAYTPYQPEIAQGRLEALLNFQTMVCDLAGLPVANASLLDEPTAAAEAMALARTARGGSEKNSFWVSSLCHPQIIAVVRTRAEALGVTLIVGDDTAPMPEGIFGALCQYPNTLGSIQDPSDWIARVHAAGAIAIVASDPMALVLLQPPGTLGADVVVGSLQRFGVPMGFGGPHAGFMAVKEEFRRQMPGRLIGVTRDSMGQVGYRLSLQTREQHIRREKATSNICTAQVLLAVMASLYAVYHGPEGLRVIARRIHRLTCLLSSGLRAAGINVKNTTFFDTLHLSVGAQTAREILRRAKSFGMNLRVISEGELGISLDEATTLEEVGRLIELFRGDQEPVALPDVPECVLPEALRRTAPLLEHPVFHKFHTETEFLRYIRWLESRDLSLTHAMIPLGSCTMKLNATSQMLPITWPEFSDLHPFAPTEQTRGSQALIRQLQDWLAEITGFSAISVQPNAGSQGEFAGLMVIRSYHQSRGDTGRTVCLIPVSAHGTNPASAVMAGFRVVPVACDSAGNIDVADLRAKAESHAAELGALMVTYPSTHGVFEESIREVCRTVHEKGGQVYMDGANMNAQVGLCRPADMGADVCHLNLHKTFCIPHGGGGPGVGPIGVAKHLTPYLPGHPLDKVGGKKAMGAVAGAPYGSAGILPISWMYIAMMGEAGLRRASSLAILNANYIARRLDAYFPVLYKGQGGWVAHECILDLRPLKAHGIEVEDVAKRLMDYGFHPPTMSWPVPGTLMVEPTESESRAELDRFCDAMIAIHAEIQKVASGEWSREDNPLKHAPHPMLSVAADQWSHGYSREIAAWPTSSLRARKFWPAVGRVDNVYGDRNLFCTCVPVSA